MTSVWTTANANVAFDHALVTSQPGGGRYYFPELPRRSQEAGSAYIIESWDGRPRGR